MIERSNRFWITLTLAGLAFAGITAVGLPLAYRLYHERRVADLEAMARACLAEGKDDQAAAVLDHYLTYRPNDLAAQRDHARLRFEQSRRPGAGRRQSEKAQSALSIAVSKNPDDQTLRRQLVITLLDLGRYGAAKTEIAALRTLTAPAGHAAEAGAVDPDDIALLEARACAGNDNRPEAIALAAGIIGFDPATGVFAAEHRPGRFETEAAILLAALLAEDHGATAGRVLERLEQTAPEDVRVWLALARWHSARGDTRRAEADITRAVSLEPDTPEVIGTAFAVALAAGRHDDATRMAERWRDLAPASPQGYLALATAARARGDTAGAVDALRAGLGALPDQPMLLATLADALLLAGRLDEAEETVRTLSRLVAAEDPTLGMLEARLLVARRQWLPAQRKLETMRPLVAAAPELKRRVDLLLAECHARLGQFDEQLAASKRVLSGDHTSLAARTSAAEALAGGGKTAEALAEFESIAAAVGGEELRRLPRVWEPLLRLRGLEQVQRPAGQRDWSKVDALLDTLDGPAGRDDADGPATSGAPGAGRVAALRYDVLLIQGARERATDLLRRAREQHPDDPDLFERSVLAALRDDGRDAAARLLDAPPAAVAGDPRLLVLQARLAALAQAGEARERLDGLDRQAAALTDAAARPLLATLASVRLAIGDTAAAERTWRTMLARDPDDLPTRLALFERVCETGDLVAAREMAAEIGHRCGDTSPPARVTQAATILLERAARRGRAVADATDDEGKQLDAVRNLLTAAEADRPGWPPIQQLFADLELARGDTAAAAARLERAAELQPDDLRVTRRLAAVLLAADRAAEAREVLARTGRELPAAFEKLAAEIDLAAGRSADAVARAERVLATGRALSADDLAWFGDLLLRSGNPGLATQAFERVVAADPANAAAWMAVVSGHVAAGDTAAAGRALANAERQLASPARELVLARGRELLGRGDEAERVLRDGLAAAPDSSELKSGLADLLARTGRGMDARRLLGDVAADEGAAGRQARRALLRLAAREGSYSDVEQAIAALDRGTAGGDGPAADDLALEASLLAMRPEPRAWRQSLALFERLSRRRRLTVPERLQRATLLDRTGQWTECRGELAALMTEPEPTSAAVAFAVEKLIAHGDTDTAAVHLRSLAERQPESPLVAGLEARLAIATRNRPAGVAAVRRLSEDAQAPAEQLAFAAELAEQLGFDRLADDLLARVAGRSAAGVVARAKFLARQDRAGEALDLIDGTADRLPSAARLQTALAVLRIEGASASPELIARIDAACTSYRREDPDHVGLALLEAELRGIEGRRDEAAGIYRHVLADAGLEPAQRTVARNNLAMLLARGETAGEARRLIDTAIADQGPHPDLIDTQGVVMLAEGAIDEAIETLREALLAPSPVKHLHLACALAARRRFEAARQALAEARESGLDPRRLDPDDRERLEALEAAVARPAS